MKEKNRLSRGKGGGQLLNTVRVEKPGVNTEREGGGGFRLQPCLSLPTLESTSFYDHKDQRVA
jgi:hypothetical protein